MRLLVKIIWAAVVALPIAMAAMLLPALIFVAAGKPQSAIVVFARAVDPDRLPSNITILSWNAHVVQLDGVDAFTARRLYESGAALVMPFRKSGCISYRKA